MLLKLNSKQLYLVIGVLFLLQVTHVHSVELALGIQMQNDSVVIKDAYSGENSIAEFDGGDSIYPLISLITEPNYLFNDSSWGYQFKFSGTYFDIEKQKVPGINKEKDIGTSIYGYTLSAVPVGFYHFNKNSKNEWNYKTGIGLGTGYMRLKGNYKVTDSSHPDFNMVKKLSTESMTLVLALYLEANLDKHTIILQNISPLVYSGYFEYQQSSITLSYSYAFDLSALTL
ncbi:hypothetical protein MACH09_35830 [Vibrio sp. MACH09]|uniref:hypothetical protein n=1 Tax=Vibrio sp. MACH09 TaxID=3025122 RepID=UPI002791AD27|nr:hypothetical protein [Vibrio sp. MACH09]GLO63075.1 hypothetical protein MACH09_35830 [Vibrio sp. MACH09]